MLKTGSLARAIPITLSLLQTAAPAFAQTGDETMCTSGEPAIKIKSCTAVIHSAWQSTDALAVAHANRGNAYALTGQFDKALADLTTAITLTPGDPETYNGRAWVYHLKGDDAKGLPDVEKAASMSPNSADIIETRAEIYAGLGRRDRAIADYRTTLKLATPDSQAAQDARRGLKRLGTSQ